MCAKGADIGKGNALTPDACAVWRIAARQWWRYSAREACCVLLAKTATAAALGISVTAAARVVVWPRRIAAAFSAWRLRWRRAGDVRYHASLQHGSGRRPQLLTSPLTPSTPWPSAWPLLALPRTPRAFNLAAASLPALRTFDLRTRFFNDSAGVLYRRKVADGAPGA